MRNHKFGPHHIDFSFLQQLPFLFFLHDVTNSPIARRCVRRNGQVIQKNQGSLGRLLKLFFSILFLFLGVGGARGALFAPGANPMVVTALDRTQLLFFFFKHFLEFK